MCVPVSLEKFWLLPGYYRLYLKIYCRDIIFNKIGIQTISKMFSGLWIIQTPFSGPQQGLTTQFKITEKVFYRERYSFRIDIIVAQSESEMLMLTKQILKVRALLRRENSDRPRLNRQTGHCALNFKNV